MPEKLNLVPKDFSLARWTGPPLPPSQTVNFVPLNCTAILEGRSVGLRGEDCGFQSVRETLNESIAWRRLISPETRAKKNGGDKKH